MTMSVQICAKERSKETKGATFVDLGFTVAAADTAHEDREQAKGQLRDLVVGWIEADNGGRSTPDVAPDTIVGAIVGRICYIAGHVWLEYGSCDVSDRVPLHAAARPDPPIRLCGALWEFLPKVEITVASQVPPRNLPCPQVRSHEAFHEVREQCR